MLNNPLDKKERERREKERREKEEKERREKETKPSAKKKDVADQYAENQAQKRSNSVSGFYPDEDVNEVLKKKQKQLGKGFKSDLINDLLREYFDKKGWFNEK